MQSLKNSRHLPRGQLRCVLGVTSGGGPPGLYLMNRIQNLQHRGRHEVDIDLLIWSYVSLVCQVYQKGGRDHVGRP